MNNYRTILCGDFNIDLMKTENKDTKNLVDLVRSYNLEATINKPTRIFNNSATLIDNIFINTNEYESGVVYSSLSDHLGQEISVTIPKQNRFLLEKQEKRNFTDKKISLIEEKLKHVQWENIQKTNNINEAYSLFCGKILDGINEICPKIVIKNVKRKKKWITNELKCRCKKKRQLYEGTIREKSQKKHIKNLLGNFKTIFKEPNKTLIQNI